MKIKFNESKRKMLAFILPAMQTESPTATSTPSAKMPRLGVTTSAVFEDPLRSATAVFVLEFVNLMPSDEIMNWQKQKQISLQSLHSSVQCKMCQSNLSVQCDLKQHKTKTSEFPTQVTQGHIQRTSFQIGLHLRPMSCMSFSLSESDESNASNMS